MGIMRNLSAVATTALFALGTTPALAQQYQAKLAFQVEASQNIPIGSAPAPALAAWQQPLATWAGLEKPTLGKASLPEATVWVAGSGAHLALAITNPSPTDNAMVTVALGLSRGVWRLELAAGTESGSVRAWRAGGTFISQSGTVTKTIFVKAGETLFVRAIETLAEADVSCREAQAALPSKLNAVRYRIQEAQAFCARSKPERVIERIHEALSDLEGLSGPPITRLRIALSEVSMATLNLRIQARTEGETTRLLVVNESKRPLPVGQLQWGPVIKTFRNLLPKKTISGDFPRGKAVEGLVQYRLGGGTAALLTSVGPGTVLPLVLTGIPLPTPRTKPTTPTLTKPTVASPKPTITMTYPMTRTTDQVDTYHGVAVSDPYRWLEDANADETKAWIAQQNELTAGFLKSSPNREALQTRLTELWDYERYGIPSREGSRYVYSRNDGLQNQSVYYVAESLDAEPRVLIDPNTLSTDGTVALAGMSLSEDGNLLAYALSSSGSDWMEWHVRDVNTGKDHTDLVKWAKFSGASWAHDASGFYYSRYAQPEATAALQGTNLNHKIYFHRLGTAQSEDTLVYERPDHPDWNLGGGVSDDGKWLIIRAAQGTERRNYVFLKSLETPDAPVTEFLTAGDASYSVIGNDGPVFYLVTDKDAPLKRIVAVDSRDPRGAPWRTVVEESKDTLQSASLFGDKLVVSYLKDARTQVRIFNLQGGLVREVTLPGIGTAVGFGGKRTDSETFFAFTSYTNPTSIYRYDLDNGVSTLFKAPKVAFDPRQYETKQVFAKSKDGTRIPIFLTHKKGLVLDGNNPVYLYGYGGFNISLTPSFSVSTLVWMELGGVYAVANLRGGGEYGREWYEAGTKLRKQNVFDDFISCAEWLIEAKYTKPSKLAIAGGSNGGLLVGACMTQRPELFGAALPAVGVLDLLRFDQFTIGWAWRSDYGDPANEADFKALLAYSPYHNLKPGTKYPATLVTTSDHDDRVVPAHSFKFAARLQASQAPEGAPTLIRIETKAGHGAGKPTAKIIEEQADIYAFLTKVLGM